MKKQISVFTAFILFCLLSSAVNATQIFYDDFSGVWDWNTSDASVFLKDNDFLYIGSDGDYNDWAERNFFINLSNTNSIIIEQRTKLESGGLNYRLPYQLIYFEDDTNIGVTYLPHGDSTNPLHGFPYGWLFDGFTGSHVQAVPGTGWWTTATADYWAVTRVVLTPDGGELYVKPDDADKGWYSNDYSLVASTAWDHSQITKIRFEQPWDSIGYVDYMSISTVPVPEPISLLLLLPGLMGLFIARQIKQ